MTVMFVELFYVWRFYDKSIQQISTWCQYVLGIVHKAGDTVVNKTDEILIRIRKLIIRFIRKIYSMLRIMRDLRRMIKYEREVGQWKCK